MSQYIYGALFSIFFFGCESQEAGALTQNDEIAELNISHNENDNNPVKESPEKYYSKDINTEITEYNELIPDLELVLKGLLTADDNEELRIKDFSGQFFGYNSLENEFILHGPIKCKFLYQFGNDDQSYWESLQLSGFLFEGKKEGDFISSELVYDGEGEYSAISGSSQEVLTFRNDKCVFVKCWEYGEGSYYSDAIENPSEGVFGYLRRSRI